MTNNFTVLDLQKVQHATFGYKNQYGQTRRLKPKCHTVNDDPIDDDEVAFNGSGLTMLQLAIKKRILDVWVPFVRFQLTANHNIQYHGEKAVSLYKEYCRRIFKKK